MCIPVLSQNEIAMKKLTIEVRDSVTYQPLADAMCRVMNATGKLQSFKVADREGQDQSFCATRGRLDFLIDRLWQT